MHSMNTMALSDSLDGSNRRPSVNRLRSSLKRSESVKSVLIRSDGLIGVRQYSKKNPRFTMDLHVYCRKDKTQHPMSPAERYPIRKRLTHFMFMCFPCRKFSLSRNNAEDERQAIWKRKQYKLVFREHDFWNSNNFTERAKANCCIVFLSSLKRFCVTSSTDSFNNKIYDIFEWAFSASFFSVLAWLMFVYVFLNIVFALLIFWSTCIFPACINTHRSTWQDAFALSWTTFSTVGYGHIHPAVNPTNNTNYDMDDMNQIRRDFGEECTLLTLLTALEAYLGVLFVSCCGALLFAKILRVQAVAPVEFGQAIVIRLADEGDRNLIDVESQDATVSKTLVSCPILEIRLVNKLANKIRGGELVDAKVEIIVIEREKDEYRDSKNGSQQKLSKMLKRRRKNTSLKNFVNAVGEYSKAHVENSEHPLFDRTWVVKHQLNENSPFLKDEVRDNIRENGSKWDRSLNDVFGVREALKDIGKILVSFKATSNSSATRVYAHHVFDANSILVGFEFAKVNYFDRKTNTLRIDFELVNDVIQQRILRKRDTLEGYNCLENIVEFVDV